jgi:hypothetical protein
MSTGTRSPEDQSIKERFPAFSLVWHRGDERKGVVYGWLEYADGTEAVYVDFGSSAMPILPEILTNQDPDAEFSGK